MPQALRPLSIIHIGSWEKSPFPLLALWGNKNWLPGMKVKKLEKFQNKMGLKGCNWSSLNAPGTETSLSHPISVSHSLFWDVLFKFSALSTSTFNGARHFTESLVKRRFAARSTVTEDLRSRPASLMISATMFLCQPPCITAPFLPFVALCFWPHMIKDSTCEKGLINCFLLKMG